MFLDYIVKTQDENQMDNSERNLAPFLFGMDNLARFKGFKFCIYGQFSIDLGDHYSMQKMQPARALWAAGLVQYPVFKNLWLCPRFQISNYDDFEAIYPMQNRRQVWKSEGVGAVIMR